VALDHESPGVRHIAYEGKHIAYLASSESAPLHLAVIPFAGGEPEKTFALPATTRPNLARRMSWAPDGKATRLVAHRQRHRLHAFSDDAEDPLLQNAK